MYVQLRNTVTINGSPFANEKLKFLAVKCLAEIE